MEAKIYKLESPFGNESNVPLNTSLSKRLPRKLRLKGNLCDKMKKS